jgi:hypothetical protein
LFERHAEAIRIPGISSSDTPFVAIVEGKRTPIRGYGVEDSNLSFVMNIYVHFSPATLIAPLI